MSAIAGIYYLDDRRVDSANLTKMIDILAHRGPDGSNVWSEGSIGFAHRMLWTTPESLLEKLPSVNQTGDIVLTADARIDNRDELIAALALNDRPSEKIADSQLVLAAYEKWGEDCPKQLLGDFAFAIWDRQKQMLLCARDHFGVKPFYYYSSGRIFVFATEIKAILCLSEVPRWLNEVKVADYLTGVVNDPIITFYQDILRLSPAHSMIVNHAGIRLQSYWSLDPSHELRLGSDKEYAEALRGIFTEAVRCRLRSAFPVGSMLSGGLDSSSIACVARKLLVEKGESQLYTFSAVFDKVTQCDERCFQNAVLAQGNLEPHRLHADQVSPLTDLDRVFWHQDEAYGSGNLYLNWSLYGPANKQGVRVILDGFDGDTTVSHGLGYLVELASAGRWVTLATEVREYSRKMNLPWRAALWSWVWKYGFDPTISKYRVLKQVRRWQALLRRTLRWRDPSANRPARWATLNPDFVQRIGLEALLQTQPGKPQTERQNHYRRLTNAGMPGTLEVLDRAAGAFSVELRFPFWDKRLAEFCLSLPPEQKLHQGWSRMVMRRAMTGILPSEVQWRGSKSNMTPSFDHGLLAFERERLKKVILEDPSAIEDYVDVTALRQAYHRYVSRKAMEGDALVIWKAVSLALWLQHASLKPQSF
jgi:asparagine synthase (glutamine-hydrolysing)